jgi:hypothetical protein
MRLRLLSKPKQRAHLPLRCSANKFRRNRKSLVRMFPRYRHIFVAMRNAESPCVKASWYADASRDDGPNVALNGCPDSAWARQACGLYSCCAQEKARQAFA